MRKAKDNSTQITQINTDKISEYQPDQPDQRSIPVGWSWVKLGDVCEINPKLDSTKRDDDTEISFVPMKAVEELSGKIDLSDERKFGKVKKGYTYFGDGDVIFAKITPCMENGKVAITTRLKNRIGFGSTEFHVLRPKNTLSNKFLFNYLIQSSYRKLAQRNMTGTAGQLRVPKKFIENSAIPLPPLPEQKKIVEKIEELFSGLDSGVASLKKAKEQIKLYRQSVLAFAFNGKLVSNGNIDEKTGLPKGWRKVKLADVAQIINGYAFKSRDLQTQGKYQVVKIGNVRPGNLRLEAKPAYISRVDEEVLIRSSLKKNDLVISLTGTRKKRDYGYVAIVTNQKNLLLNQRLAIIRPNKEYDPKFFLYLLRMDIFLDQFFKNETGNVGQGNVGIGGIRDSIVPVPSLNIQTQIVEEIEKRFSEADNLEKAIDESLTKSETLRQSILKQAFEGKLSLTSPEF